MTSLSGRAGVYLLLDHQVNRHVYIQAIIHG